MQSDTSPASLAKSAPSSSCLADAFRLRARIRLGRFVGVRRHPDEDVGGQSTFRLGEFLRSSRRSRPSPSLPSRLRCAICSWSLIILFLNKSSTEVHFHLLHRHVRIRQQHRQRSAGAQRLFEILLALLDFLLGNAARPNAPFRPGPAGGPRDCRSPAAAVSLWIAESAPGAYPSALAKTDRPASRLDLRAGNARLVHPNRHFRPHRRLGFTVCASFLPHPAASTTANIPIHRMYCVMFVFLSQHLLKF